MTVFKAMRVRLSQGKQVIADVRAARPTGFRGLPRIAAGACAEGCDACVAVCPTSAMRLDPVSIDLGRCIFCNECGLACPEAKIEWTADPHMGAVA